MSAVYLSCILLLLFITITVAFQTSLNTRSPMRSSLKMNQDRENSSRSPMSSSSNYAKSNEIGQKLIRLLYNGATKDAFERSMNFNVLFCQNEPNTWGHSFVMLDFFYR